MINSEIIIIINLIYFVCISIEKETRIIIIIIVVITVVTHTRVSNLLLYSFETERTRHLGV